MANWVKTFIRLKGEKEDLDKLESMMTYQYAGENWLDRQRFFSKLIPMPESISEDDADYWKDDHWGTKWEPRELWYSRSDNQMLEFACETAWGTPKGIFEAITKQLPSIILGGYYADENLGYNCGLIVGNKHHVETLRMGDESDAAVKFSEKVWGMVADEVYIGKRLEKILKKPTPDAFIKVGLCNGRK